MLNLIINGTLIGLGATIIMDIWALVLTQFPGQSRPNWGLVGRWFWHLRKGQIFHDDIAASKPYAHEVALGWIGHYAVGILYGIIFALYGGAAWFANPIFLPQMPEMSVFSISSLIHFLPLACMAQVLF